MDLLPMNMSPEKGKLQGAEKYFGYVVAAAGFVGFLFLAKYLFPIITSAIMTTQDMVWAAIKLAATVVATLGVVVVIWKMRHIVSYWFNVMVKLTWTAMIEANPIAGMKYSYDRWMNQADELNKTIVLLAGREKLIKDKINSRSKEASNYFAAGLKAQEMAKEAEGEEDRYDLSNAASSNAIMAQRRKESIDVFMPRLKTIQAALNFSTKLHKAWSNGLKLLKDDIEVKEEDLDDLKTIAGAFETAQSIISGNTNERAIYEEAVKAYGKQISDYVGKCKRFTEMAKDYALNVDVQNAIDTDKGNKFLNEYDIKQFEAELDYNKLLMASPSRSKLSMGQSSNQFRDALDNTTVSHSRFDQLP